MTKQYAILGNYKNRIKTAYIPGWDRVFSQDGLSTICQAELHIVEKKQNYGKLLVKDGKALGKAMGMRVKDSCGIVVNKATRDEIAKHFAPELNKTLWIKEL
jgi:hypothetical protein